MTEALELLTWYDKVARALPWRETKDPYFIWLSEVMLQQTQVSTVIVYYERFIKAFPKIEDLAEADEELVFKLWEGLGYYSRASRLMQCARVLVEKYEGDMPRTLEQMLKLPGIGPYTAGAILSIAFDEPVPAVDGNVFRVMTRRYGIFEDIQKPLTRKIVEAQVMRLIPQRAGDFNQGLMELGATICTPKNPKCNQCPWQAGCFAYSSDSVEQLPVKEAKVKPLKQTQLVAVVINDEGVLFEKRGVEGLLSSLWGFPTVLYEENICQQSPIDFLTENLSEQYDMKVRNGNYMGRVRHVFTHRIWEMEIYTFKTDERPQIDMPQLVWLKKDAFNDVTIPTAYMKIIKLVFSNKAS